MAKWLEKDGSIIYCEENPIDGYDYGFRMPSGYGIGGYDTYQEAKKGLRTVWKDMKTAKKKIAV